MDDEELREIGDSIEEGDEIAIGRLDINLTVTAQPLEDNTGALLVEAGKNHHPQEGVVTSIMISLGHPSGGDNLMIEEYEMKERSDGLDGYHVGERLEEGSYELDQLSVID